jgi:predicted naringenin-chalcone synthase
MDILATAVPELASAAAAKAIAEWGRPAAEITHLIVSTYSSGGHMPGADFRLATLLGLPSSVQRTMLYMYGCTGTSAALRAAKDIAENNGGARGPHAHAVPRARRGAQRDLKDAVHV